MTRIERIKPEFVELMPKPLKNGVLYISEKYATASHNCCCGCGTRIVTPLKPSGWNVTVRDGDVTLYPSIGNWSAACRSHYWIENGSIVWARQYSEREIKENRANDQLVVERYYKDRKQRGFWKRIWKVVRGWFS